MFDSDNFAKPMVLRKKTQQPRTTQPAGASKIQKAENETENFTIKRVRDVCPTMGNALQQARAAKQWTQKELAAKAQVPHNKITELENMTAQWDGNLVAKLEKVLGTKLPRPNK